MRKRLVSVAFTAATLLCQPAQAGEATPGEIVALPRFCWQEYKAASGPEFSMPLKACGNGMNHYCSGLVNLIRAKRSVRNPVARIGNLNRAKEKTLYTLKAMEKHPNCPLRKHAESTLTEIEAMLRVSGRR